MISVCAIIPSSCSKKIFPYLNNCLNSLDLSSVDANIKLNIILVSNFKKLYISRIKDKIDLILKYPGPFNFAFMNNKAIEEGLRRYKPDYFIFLNDDASVEKQFFSVFKKNLRKYKFDILIPILYKDQSHKKIDSFGIEYYKSGYSRTSDNLKSPTSLACGSCMLTKASFLQKMKNKYGYCFNELLESYYEDIEFSIRALGVGGKFKKESKLIGTHIESLTSGFRSRYVFYKSYRNVFWVILLCWPARDILRNFIPIFIVQSWFVLHGLYKFGLLFMLGIVWENLRNFLQIFKNRQLILSSYNKSFRFQQIINKHMFKTGKGIIF